MSKPKLYQFEFSVRCTVENCMGLVTAETEKEARQKLARGEWDELHVNSGELVDWDDTGRAIAQEEIRE